MSVVFLVALGSGLIGIMVGKYRVWPYQTVQTLHGHLTTLWATGKWERDGRLVEAPEEAARQRVTVHDPAGWMPGYRAIMGWDAGEDAHRIWLLDPAGEIVHVWPVDYHRIDPDGPLGGRDDPHGMAVLDDGSVLVNFDFGDALARIDACGEPIWVQPGVFHHIIEPAGDGTFWTWLGEGSAHGHRQHLVNFDGETGRILQKLDLVEDYIEGEPELAAIFGLPHDFAFQANGGDPKDPSVDIFHPNDIEPLSEERAAAFPSFEAGDLLASFRTIDLVAVLDPDDKTVKWWRRGPWRQQHDPDFGDDGRIVVYSNNPTMGQSTLIALDPESDDVELAFLDQDLDFFSPFMGLHHSLPNDTRMVVIPYEGRVLETTWQGEVTFEFNNVFTDDYNGHVANALWLPVDHFEALPVCPAR